MSSELLESLYKSYPLYQELFDKQLEFALAPSRYVAALCSRRSGKTVVCAIKAFQELLSNPNSLGLYLALTDSSVVDIFMPVVRPLMSKYKIQATLKADEVTFSNGSKLLLGGANHINKIESYRGIKLRFCIIDEAASFADRILHYLVDEIIGPALIDHRGQLILIGTPANHCSGLFYDVTAANKEANWIVKRWTGLDNPHVAYNFKLESMEFLKRKKATESLPKFRREYLGEWATDSDALLINSFHVAPFTECYDEDWRSVVGIDFGFNDETAFSVIGWKRNNPTAFVLETQGFTGMSVSMIANTLVNLKTKYKPIRIVGDPAGASKIMMKEFQDKYHVYIEAASKQNKAHYIEILNDALINANLILVEGRTEALQSEMKKVIWNEDHSRELEGIKCDNFDATLYAYREALAYIEKIPQKIIKTPEMEAKEMIEKQIQYDRKMRGIKQYGNDFSADISKFIGGRR